MHRASPKHRQRTDWRASVEQATSQRDRDSTAVMHRASPVGCPAHLARCRDLSPSHPLAAWNRLCHALGNAPCITEGIDNKPARVGQAGDELA